MVIKNQMLLYFYNALKNGSITPNSVKTEIKSRAEVMIKAEQKGKLSDYLANRLDRGWKTQRENRRSHLGLANPSPQQNYRRSFSMIRVWESITKYTPLCSYVYRSDGNTFFLTAFT